MQILEWRPEVQLKGHTDEAVYISLHAKGMIPLFLPTQL